MLKTNSERKSGVLDLRRSTKIVKSNIVRTAPARSQRNASLSRPVWPWLIGLLVIIAAASFAGFWYFGQKPATPRSLSLKVNGPEKMVGGTELSLEIVYENSDQVNVNNIEIAVTYPKGFYYNTADTSPYNTESNLWRLPELAPGQSGRLKITGQVYGITDEIKEFPVMLSYQPVNFPSNFQENAVYKVQIEKSLIDFKLTAPEKINDGENVTFNLIYKNNQETDATGLNIAFAFPEKGFRPDDATAEILKKGYQFLDNTLKPGEEKNLTLSGKLDRTIGNPFKWSARAWQIFKINETDVERNVFEKSAEINIEAPDLKITLTSDKDKINWGEEINYKINCFNGGQSDVVIDNLKLIASDLIDWAKVKLPDGAKKEDLNIVWSFTKDSADNVIAVNQSKEFNITLPLLGDLDDIFAFEGNAQNLQVKAELSLVTESDNKTFSSDTITVPLIAAPKLTTEAKYYNDSGNKVGSGPLPPVVGKKTVYRVYWKILPGSTGLDNLKMEATLPIYVVFDDWTNKPASGNVSYDAATRKVSWQIETLSAFGNDLATFDLAITPETSQFNQLLILTNATQITAKDFNQTLPLLTSELLGDATGSKFGGVVTVQQ